MGRAGAARPRAPRSRRSTVSRTLSAPSAAVHWFGPAPDELEQPLGRVDSGARRVEHGLDRVGHRSRRPRSAPSGDRDLRDAHQRAEVAGGEGGRALGIARLDVGARRSAARDDDRLGALGPRPLEDGVRVALGAAVAQEEERVAGSRPRAVRRRHRPPGPATPRRRRPAGAMRPGWRHASSCRCRPAAPGGRGCARRRPRPARRRPGACAAGTAASPSCRASRSSAAKTSGWRPRPRRTRMPPTCSLCGRPRPGRRSRITRPRSEDAHLRDLFAADPARGERMNVEAVGLYLDYSKHRATDETIGAPAPARRGARAPLADRGDVLGRAHQRDRGALGAPRGAQGTPLGVDRRRRRGRRPAASTRCSTACRRSPIASGRASGRATPAARSETSSTSGSAAPTSAL